MPRLQLFQLIQLGIYLFIRPVNVGLRGFCHDSLCLRHCFRTQRRYRLCVLFRQRSGIGPVAAVKLRPGKKLFHAQPPVKMSVHKAQPEPFIHQRRGPPVGDGARHAENDLALFKRGDAYQRRFLPPEELAGLVAGPLHDRMLPPQVMHLGPAVLFQRVLQALAVFLRYEVFVRGNIKPFVDGRRSFRRQHVAEPTLHIGCPANLKPLRVMQRHDFVRMRFRKQADRAFQEVLVGHQGTILHGFWCGRFCCGRRGRLRWAVAPQIGKQVFEGRIFCYGQFFFEFFSAAFLHGMVGQLFFRILIIQVHQCANIADVLVGLCLFAD